MLLIIKESILKECNIRGKKKKNNVKNLKIELARLEVENHTLIDKIAFCSSLIVQQGLERKIEKNIKLIEQTKSNLKSIEEITDITDKIDLACEVLGNPYYIRKNGNIEEKQLLL